MPETTESAIDIAADPETVLDIVADVESYPEWIDGMKAARILSEDDDGWVEQAEFTLESGPIKDTYVLEYGWDIAEDSTGVMSWSLVRAGVLSAMSGSYTLTERDGGTHVVYSLAVDLKIPLPGMIRRKAERALMSAALQELKKRAEA